MHRISALAGALLIAVAACSDGTGPDSENPPAELTIVSGNSQSDTVTRTLNDTLVAQLQDNQGRGVQDAVISWVVTEGNGEVFSPSTGADEQGFTRNLWTLLREELEQVSLVALGMEQATVYRRNRLTGPEKNLWKSCGVQIPPNTLQVTG